jgi:hypothetical protein
MKMTNSGVIFDETAAFADDVIKMSKKTKKFTADPVYLVAKSLESVMNGTDPMVDGLSGLALKTYQYRNMLAVPDLANISVSDRIAQRLASGSITGVQNSQGVIHAASPDHVADIAIGRAEGTTAAVPQEGAWFVQRLSEMLRGGRGAAARNQIGQAYPLSANEIESLFQGQRIPGLEERVLEGRRVGKNYKPALNGRVIDPNAVQYAQQFSNVGVPTMSTPTAEISLPLQMRTPSNIDLTESGILLGQALAPALSSLRTPRSYALALLAGGGLLGANELSSDQQPTEDPLLALARRNLGIGPGYPVYQGTIT